MADAIISTSFFNCNHKNQHAFMRSFKSLSRLPVRHTQRALSSTPVRRMSFFPRNFIAQEPSTFHPLFRLLDDFDSYTRTSNTPHHLRSSGSSNTMRSFTPRFDVKELEDTYELHGELAGVDRKDIQIEFSDSQTLRIYGRTEHSRTEGTPPASIEGSKPVKALGNGSQKVNNHQATVEDENPTSSSTPAAEYQVAKSTDASEVTPSTTSTEPQARYWVSERSVGEFSRSFTFPVRVDLEGVQASMKNGILSIIVPKSKEAQGRKIAIN